MQLDIFLGVFVQNFASVSLLVCWVAYFDSALGLGELRCGIRRLCVLGDGQSSSKSWPKYSVLALCLLLPSSSFSSLTLVTESISSFGWDSCYPSCAC